MDNKWILWGRQHNDNDYLHAEQPKGKSPVYKAEVVPMRSNEASLSVLVTAHLRVDVAHPELFQNIANDQIP